MDNLGQRIRTAREAAGFTQESLAEAIGVSRTAVARWEANDTEPKLQNLVCIATLLNVSTDFLLGIDTASKLSDIALPSEAVKALNKFISLIRK